MAFHRKVLFLSDYAFPWDFRSFFLPMAAAFRDALRSSQSPLWDPYTYCGRPVFADPQARLFYPPHALTAALAAACSSHVLPKLLEWQLALHVFAAGAFTYLFLRRMGVSAPGALCGGFIFELGGFFAAHTENLAAIEAATWIPLLWLAAWELRLGWSERWFAVFSTAGALSLLAGFPTVTIAACAATFLLAALWCITERGHYRRLVPLALGFFLSAGLAAILLVPAAQLTLRSVAQYRTDWLDGSGLPPASLVSLVFPDRYDIFDLKQYRAPGDPTFLYLYCGLAGLALALISLTYRTCWKKSLPVAGVTLCSGVWMLGNLTPFGSALLWLTPRLIRGSLYPQYASATFCLGIAVLAGFGLERFQRFAVWSRYAIAAVVAADLVLAGSGHPMNQADLRQEPGFGPEQIAGSPALLTELRRLTRVTRPPARIDTAQNSVEWSTAAPLTRLPSANGYNPLALERLIQVRLSFARGQRWGAWYEVEDPNSRVLDLMSVRYVLAREPLVNTRLQKIAELPGTQVYENRAALPRFWLVHHIRQVEGMDRAIQAIRRPGFEPDTEAVVETGSHLPDFRTPGTAVESVNVLRYETGNLELRVHTASPAYLASSEAYYPGWRAALDGVRVPIYLTNGAFRGLFVPAGEHTILMEFAPGKFWIGAGITVLSILILVFFPKSVFNYGSTGSRG